MIKVILWDIDNTLLDFDVAEKVALIKEFEEFGLGVFTDELLKQYMGINKALWQKLERGEITKPEVLVGRFEQFFGSNGISTEIAADFDKRYQELLGETVCFHDNAYEIVKELKGKVLQCAASNGTKRAQTGKLRNSGLGELFDLVFISEDVGVEKPAKEFFDKALRDVEDMLKEQDGGQKKLELSEVLMVGDSLTSDMKGANNAGIKACWYNPKGIVNDKDVSIDYEIKDLHEIFELCTLA